MFSIPARDFDVKQRLHMPNPLLLLIQQFHGPKGIGFLYVNKKAKVESMIHGGAQERGFRGGTENVYGIVGLAKALEMALHDVEAHQKHVQKLQLT